MDDFDKYLKIYYQDRQGQMKMEPGLGTWDKLNKKMKMKKFFMFDVYRFNVWYLTFIILLGSYGLYQVNSPGNNKHDNSIKQHHVPVQTKQKNMQNQYPVEKSKKSTVTTRVGTTGKTGGGDNKIMGDNKGVNFSDHEPKNKLTTQTGQMSNDTIDEANVDIKTGHSHARTDMDDFAEPSSRHREFHSTNDSIENQEFFRQEKITVQADSFINKINTVHVKQGKEIRQAKNYKTDTIMHVDTVRIKEKKKKDIIRIR